MLDDDTSEADGGLIDLTGVTLHDLDSYDRSSLGEALRRLQESSLNDTDPIAGWNNSV